MLSEEKIYAELCSSYRGIDDFRARLLGFLPLATGAGILFTAKEGLSLLQKNTQPIAVFGFLVTLGLFFYEIYGIRKCAELILTGKKIERAQNVQGQFISRPQAVFGSINEPLAAGVIYPAVLGSWMVVWFLHWNETTSTFQSLSSVAWIAAGLVFAAGLSFTVAYDKRLKGKDRKKCDVCKRPFEDGESARTRTTNFLKTSPDYWLCNECSEALVGWLEDRRLEHPE